MNQKYTNAILAIFSTIALLTIYHSTLAQTPTADTSSVVSLAVASNSHINQFTCADINEIPPSECEALVALYASTAGTNWRNQAGWLVNTSPCSWNGVDCEDSGHVIYLFLNSNNLSGMLPPDLRKLTQLREVGLSSNQLTGTLPIQLSDLKNLTVLDLRANQLSGAIPVSLLLQLPNLTYLDLAQNRFTGRIPKDLSSHSALQGIALYDNQLEGEVPAEFGNFAKLTSLELQFNKLSGSLPSQLGQLTHLAYLDLRGNQFTGTLPTQLGNLTELTRLLLSNNQFTGEIPVSLANLVNLEWLDLSQNQLSGSLPAGLGDLTNLESLKVDHNQLSGAIPPQLGNAHALGTLSLSQNLFEGALPGSLVHLKRLGGFHFDETDLCELSDSAFQAWLASIGILKKSGKVCLETTFSITGTVHDVRNKPIRTVVIDNGLGEVDVSGFDGKFAFAGLPAGVYTLTATFQEQPLRPATYVAKIPPDLSDVAFQLDPEPPTGGIANIQQFIDQCPQNDPIYTQLRSDFILRRNGSIIGDIPCNEPISAMSPEDYTIDLSYLQALRSIYYMDNRQPGSLPWTSLSLYEWLKSRVRGINFRDDIEYQQCCQLIDGQRYIMIINHDQDSTNIFYLLIEVAVLFHEARHADGFPHNSACGVPDGCDETYDESNLSPYGMQYWLSKQWLLGKVYLGLPCLSDSEFNRVIENLISFNEDWVERFVAEEPDSFILANPAGGICSPYIASPVYLDLGTMTESNPSAEGFFRIQQAGTQPRTWTINANVEWITVEPASGSGSSMIHVTANSSSLENGSYTGQLTVQTSDPTVPPQAITVKVNAGTSSLYLPIISQ
ncbi:MAG: hypothetical protein R3C14_01935 [Caldilineaceae bacterium]